MSAEAIPFLLAAGETVVKDASSIQYYGVGLYSAGLLGGKMTGSGWLGGISSSKQVKMEKSIFDSQNCHVYLTNNRVVFVKAKLSLLSRKENKLEGLFSDIPLESVEGVYAGTKLLIPTVELAVKSPSGEVNRIAFAFLKSGLSKRTEERDGWIQLITKHKANLSQAVLGKVSEDPLGILKLRYAKGEITNEQYEQMKKSLTD